MGVGQNRMVELNLMSNVKIAIVAVMVSMLFVGACGRRGDLEPPPVADNEDNPEKVEQNTYSGKTFILDPLI